MNERSPALDAKYALLRDTLLGLGNVAVAYSGGVDSSLLLKVAYDELGDGVMALIAVSPLLPRSELKNAVEVAEEIGASLMQVPVGNLDDEHLVMNPKDRCYWCKLQDLGELGSKAKKLGFGTLVDGTNADDRRAPRPGLRSLEETGTRSPLAEAGLSKAEVRELARSLGLSNWNKPSNPCLASRIPYGERITAEKLDRIERAEDALRSLGFRQVRVRLHGDLARIELEQADIPSAVAIMNKVTATVKKAGFRYVTLDMEGYRSGSMDE